MGGGSNHERINNKNMLEFHFNNLIELNASDPYVPIRECLNINSDYRFRTNFEIVKKIAIKEFQVAYNRKTHIGESCVVLDKKMQLIIYELREKYNNQIPSLSVFKYNKEHNLASVCVTNELRIDKELTLNYYNNTISFERDNFIHNYYFSDDNLIEYEMIEKHSKIVDTKILLFYNELNEVVKIEEYSQYDWIDDGDEKTYYDKPELLFETNFKVFRNVSSGYEVDFYTLDIKDKINKRSTYVFNNNGLLLKHVRYKDDNVTIDCNTFYEYEFDKKGNWTYLKLFTLFLNSSEISNDCWIIEREIEYY